METREAEAAARMLIEARERRRPVAAWPESSRPRSFPDAYAVQAAFARLRGPKVVGYKVGCASEQSQKLAGSPGPILGRLFAPDCRSSPAVLPADDFFLVGVEAEFGFVIGEPPALGGAPCSRAQAAAAVAAVLPMVEICDTRLADWRTAGIEQITADNAFNGGLVLGRAEPDWGGLDLATHEAALYVDDELRGRGPGALVLGHPLDSLAWLATELAHLGVGFAPGDMIAAGTCTGLHFVQPGARVRAEFGALGRVEFEVRAAG